MDTRTLLLLALAVRESEALAEATASLPESVQKAPLADQDSNSSSAPEDLDDQWLADLLQMNFSHEAAEGDVDQMRRLLDWANARGLANLLPQLGAESDPLASKSTPSSLPSSLLVAKALPIQKAWGVTGGTIIEGWVSTEDEDQDHDIVPPEAFQSALAGYAERRMPLSSEHSMKSYPVGHGQRIALLRDGAVLAQATHPTDPAEFEHLPTTGSGVYGRFLITEPDAATAVAKGNIGGFSWVGRVSRYDRRPTGRGRVFRQVDPWMESTIAAYPINSRAILLNSRLAANPQE